MLPDRKLQTLFFMNNAVFCDVVLCKSYVNRRSGGAYRLRIHGKKIRERGTSVSMCLQPSAHAGS
jgi:hypothetical protein